jgi:hypothetical protein
MERVAGAALMAAFHPLRTFAKGHDKTAVPLGDEHMTGSSESRAYRAGVAVAVVASFLTVWTTIVRDDGTGAGFFLLIMAAVVGAFAAWFEPAGMARALLGVAIMQLSFGIAIATAPSIASTPDGSLKALLFNGFFAALWLLSAVLFRVASNRDHKVATAN